MVYKKYSGLCAYTGQPLGEDWQVDHVIPKCLTIQSFSGFEKHDDFGNLLPACKIVNHYKRSLDLEGFRIYMLNFHKRLAKLPKNTMVKSTQRRKEYMQEIADLFGIATDRPFSGVFFFETVNQHP